MDGWWCMMLLMVLAGDEMTLAPHESRSLLARDEAEDERRKEARRLLEEKRAVMAWNRGEACILLSFSG
ncbi:hypothetical protein HYQ46_009701 [Verticillium longisporum]|nr:hypothetical protein HYQ46_009701 [Verticillium longisporum]